MKSKLFVMLSVLIIVLGVTVSSAAQKDWTDFCHLPDLDEFMRVANEARADDDIVAYANIMNGMARYIDWISQGCLEVAVLLDVDLQGTQLNDLNLHRVDLSGANLQDAVFCGAYLRGTDLGFANLQNANISSHPQLCYASLEEANLSNANLQGALLRNANLRGAHLSGANLLNATLTYVQFDEDTSLPDGTDWTPDTDMTRFTDPEHPDFWNPCAEFEEQPWYCEELGE